MEEATLNEINTDMRLVHEKKREMFQAWLRGDPDASYSKLIKALLQVEETTLAHTLCSKLGT